MEEDKEKKAIGITLTVGQASTEKKTFNDLKFPVTLCFNIDQPEKLDYYAIPMEELQQLLKNWKINIYKDLTPNDQTNQENISITISEDSCLMAIKEILNNNTANKMKISAIRHTCASHHGYQRLVTRGK